MNPERLHELRVLLTDYDMFRGGDYLDLLLAAEELADAVGTLISVGADLYRALDVSVTHHQTTLGARGALSRWEVLTGENDE